MSDPIRILLVDDEAAFLRMTEKELSDRDPDFDIITEDDPTEVSNRVAEEGVDCIVCDYQMPEMDGLEVYQHLRENDHDIPFFLYTGEGNQQVATAALELGVTDYIRKNSDPEQFTVMANRLRRAVRGHRSLVNSDDHDSVVSRVVEDSPDGVLIHDGDEIIHVNDRFADIVGADRRQQLLGQSPDEYIEFDEVEEIWWETNTEAPENEWHDATLATVMGGEKPVKVAPVVIPYDGRRVVRLIVTGDRRH